MKLMNIISLLEMGAKKKQKQMILCDTGMV